MGFYEEMGDIHLENRDNKYVIKEVTTLQAMGALISKEADSMSALKFRLNKADKALWMDIQFYKNKGIPEGRKHKRYREGSNRAFFTHVKAGLGTRKWWTLCMAGRAGTWTS